MQETEKELNNDCSFALQRCVQTVAAGFYFEYLLWVCWKLWMFLEKLKQNNVYIGCSWVMVSVSL